MLPFLQKKTAQTGLIVKQRTPDEKSDTESDSEDATGIHACAQDLIDAVHSKDVKAAADAIKAAFTILDSEPHEEEPHVEPHSYAAQNAAAAKGT